jgi:hypothetical protein
MMAERNSGESSEGVKQSLREDQDLFVVAIDFGTSYTGYAYSQRNEFERDPLRIYGMKVESTNNQVHSMFYVRPNSGIKE